MTLPRHACAIALGLATVAATATATATAAAATPASSGAVEPAPQPLARLPLPPGHEAAEHRLDVLAARGYGLVRRDPPAPEPAASRPADSAFFVPATRGELRARRDAELVRANEEAARRNVDTQRRLDEDVEAMRATCGGTLADAPEPGMTDAAFRACTLAGRFGGPTQVVVAQDGTRPLRLYVLGAGRIRRVYSVDGVVTLVRP